MTTPAPYFDDVADGPAAAEALFVRAADGKRIRIVRWDAAAGRNGTVLIFPGRTEYLEKYGRAAVDFAQRGFASAAVDWRGQGLADRLIDNTLIGHVGVFGDYQLDVAALLEAVADMPRPFYLVAHSMGGCIGLRALIEGLDVPAAAFTAPMWGLHMTTPLRMAAWSLGWVSRKAGLSHLRAPGTGVATYTASEAFENNVLTSDRDMFDYMQHQTAVHPELALAGPSLHWVYEAMAETKRLSALPAPDIPALAALGGNERVVAPEAIRTRMASWPEGSLLDFPGAEHEVMMERPAARSLFFDSAAGLFSANGATSGTTEPPVEDG